MNMHERRRIVVTRDDYERYEIVISDKRQLEVIQVNGINKR